MRDPYPDKGRALARLEEKQGRTLHKGQRHDEHDESDTAAAAGTVEAE